MASITDYTLPNVRKSLAENHRLLDTHRLACQPCATSKPTKTAWCPDGWQLHGANRQLQSMIRRMEDIQLADRQPSLFDDSELTREGA
jgi:hypothetical protein